MEEICNISGYLRKTTQPLLQEVKAFGLVPDLEPKADFVSGEQTKRIENYHRGEMEGLLAAAQDQALSTRAMQQGRI